MNTTMPVTLEQALTMMKLADAGFCNGIGTSTPGQMCVEAAVCFALGQPHGDEPACVGPISRAFKIRLNDSNWSSNAARGAGLRDIMLAQLGTADWPHERAWLKLVAERVIREIVPMALRAACKRAKPEHAKAMEAAAVRCELEGTREASEGARAEARAYADDAADAAAYAAYAAADAAAYAAARSKAIAEARDRVLCHVARIGVDCYSALGAPGIALLDAVRAEEAAK